MRIFSILVTVALMTPLASAKDKLVILSPHRKSVQEEFIPVFKEYYKNNFKTEVQVEWLDQGGTSDDIRFLRSKFDQKTQTSGIDIFWGGGASTFVELNLDKLLDKYELPADLKKDIPQNVGGATMYDESHTWYATALSSFGIFYNKKILKFEGIKEPSHWQDLADPAYIENISLADPRRSGTATMMNQIIIQSLGWEKGWELLTAIAGNASKFTHSSTDPIKAVVSGDVMASMAIDYYANAKIGDLGSDNLGFALPEGETVLDADPIAIIKGAPNRKVAERFVNFILSKDAQKILILPKGAKGGPQITSLGRMAVNKTAYEDLKDQKVSSANPFLIKNFLQFDIKKSGQTQRIFTDLLGAIHIDTHKNLKKAWKTLTKGGITTEEVKKISAMPIDEKQLLDLSTKWDDNVLRNKTINSWVEFSNNKFENIAKGK